MYMCMSFRCSDEETFDLWFALAVSILAFAGLHTFSAALVLLWCSCFFANSFSGGTKCFTVHHFGKRERERERDGAHCAVNIPNLQKALSDDPYRHIMEKKLTA